jgi:hypothetical protein
MNIPGGNNLLVEARSALLDALEALQAHRDSVIVIGAQAIYLHTGAAMVALAEMTKDSDLALDARALADEPLIEEAMRVAGFYLDPKSDQPGAWLSAHGVPVDLMVPEALAGEPGRRGARIPPHSKKAARRAAGLEAAIVDHGLLEICALAPGDHRVYRANVAGPAALLVAKLHKIGERQQTPGRLVDKDAHDIYRLLTAIPTAQLARSLQQLRRDSLASDATTKALSFLGDLFAAGPSAIGSAMAGRAEEGVGEPQTVAAATAFLAEDLIGALEPVR